MWQFVSSGLWLGSWKDEQEVRLTWSLERSEETCSVWDSASISATENDLCFKSCISEVWCSRLRLACVAGLQMTETYVSRHWNCMMNMDPFNLKVSAMSWSSQSSVSHEYTLICKATPTSSGIWWTLYKRVRISFEHFRFTDWGSHLTMAWLIGILLLNYNASGLHNSKAAVCTMAALKTNGSCCRLNRSACISLTLHPS